MELRSFNLGKWKGRTPEELKALREPLETELEQVKAEIALGPDRHMKTVDPEETENIKRDIQKLMDRRNELYKELDEIPECDDSYIQRYKLYQRGTETEQTLIQALIDGKLTFWCPFGYRDGPDLWEQKRGYQYSIELSQARWPSEVTEKKRQFVRLHKEVFDKWLETIPPADEDEIKQLSQFGQASFHFQKLVHERQGKPPTKTSIVDELMRTFPDLSERQAKKYMGSRRSA